VKKGTDDEKRESVFQELLQVSPYQELGCQLVVCKPAKASKKASRNGPAGRVRTASRPLAKQIDQAIAKLKGTEGIKGWYAPWIRKEAVNFFERQKTPDHLFPPKEWTPIKSFDNMHDDFGCPPLLLHPIRSRSHFQ
jgi:hypothetical protein